MLLVLTCSRNVSKPASQELETMYTSVDVRHHSTYLAVIVLNSRCIFTSAPRSRCYAVLWTGNISIWEASPYLFAPVIISIQGKIWDRFYLQWSGLSVTLVRHDVCETHESRSMKKGYKKKSGNHRCCKLYCMVYLGSLLEVCLFVMESAAPAPKCNVIRVTASTRTTTTTEVVEHYNRSTSTSIS